MCLPGPGSCTCGVAAFPWGRWSRVPAYPRAQRRIAVGRSARAPASIRGRGSLSACLLLRCARRMTPSGTWAAQTVHHQAHKRQTGPMSTRAGLPAEASDLIDIDELIAAYYDRKPDASVPEQRVAFGTSGHRGSSLATSFNEDHILATTAAICRYRRSQRIDGPLFLGRDTHGLSEPAFRTAIEVLVADGVQVLVDHADGYTPTPGVSHAILTYNRGRSTGLADGIVVTPSHNPPTDGGFKYNPPNGGPAGQDITGGVEAAANRHLEQRLDGVKRMPHASALKAATTHRHD